MVGVHTYHEVSDIFGGGPKFFPFALGVGPGNEEEDGVGS